VHAALQPGEAVLAALEGHNLAVDD
jgi:hypothetical protein